MPAAGGLRDAGVLLVDVDNPKVVVRADLTPGAARPHPPSMRVHGHDSQAVPNRLGDVIVPTAAASSPSGGVVTKSSVHRVAEDHTADSWSVGRDAHAYPMFRSVLR